MHEAQLTLKNTLTKGSGKRLLQISPSALQNDPARKAEGPVATEPPPARRLPALRRGQVAPELWDTCPTSHPPRPWLASQHFQNSQQTQMKTKCPDVSRLPCPYSGVLKHRTYGGGGGRGRGTRPSPLARDICHHSQHVQPLLPVHDTPLFEMTIALVRKSRIQKFHQNT